MPLVIEWAGGSLLIDEDRSAVIGRDPDVDITIDHQKVSRHHIAVQFEAGVWGARDLGSSNGTLVDDQTVASVVVVEPVVLQLGGKTGPRITLTALGTDRRQVRAVVAPEASGLEGMRLGSRMSLSTRFRIGRDSSNDLVIDELLVSRFHAEITSRDGSSFDIVDLGSANGTFVNGQLVRRHKLAPEDLLTVGQSQFRYTSGALEPEGTSGGFRFSVDHVSVVVGGRRLLNEISFDLKPRSLTAVVGPSGAGKSTLLDVLTGQRTPTLGSVEFAGRDLHASYEELRQRLGFVPQADLLHTNLTTRRALDFGADLRFPRDTTRVERRQRVETVMNELGLTERADLRIDALSGGQRKRVSVALELLTEPVLLFLDEPTSGLDPGLDRQVMNLLRRLADDGRTVLVVTHSTANLDVCDDVVVLAPGGNLAHFGSPHTVLRALGANDWAEAFESLERRPASSWSGTGNSTRVRRAEDDRATLAPQKSQPWFNQLGTLMLRYVAVIRADRAYLLLLGLLPLLLAAVGYIVGSEHGIGPGASGSAGINIQARSLLLIVILGSVFMGAATAVQELVKERAIFHRERSTGLSSTAYLASKIAVLGCIAVLQSLVFVVLTLIGRDYPEDPLFSGLVVIDVLVPIALLTFVSMVVGLVISASIRTSEIAMPALVLVTMLFVVLSGAVPLRFDDVLSWLGVWNPAYWAMNSLAAVTDLNALLGSTADTSVIAWGHEPSSWITGVAILAAVGLIGSIMLTLLSAVRRERR
jgi:ABC-type multidrug transport system ATPase subunit/pSer/pThr/pTyr-binding forkhead associated (FHA) protein